MVRCRNNTTITDNYMKKIMAWIGGIIALILFLALFTGVRAYRQLNPTPPASQAFVNGQLLTMDAENSIVEAVYIEDDRIVAVGSTADIEQFITGKTAVTDLEGATMMPGFVDAHSHFPGSGASVALVDLNSPPIGTVTSIEQALMLLKEKADTTPKGDWVVGIGYDDTLLAEMRHFNRAELDTISTDHPIYVMHISGHMGVANSVTLSEAGITADSPDPAGGEYVRDEVTNELTGLLTENAHHPMRTRALDFSKLQFYRIFQASIDDYLGHGVTTAQSGLTSRVQINLMSQASNIGIVPLRLAIWPEAADGLEMDDEGVVWNEYETDKLHIGAFKIIADGSIQGYTGYLAHPYHITPAHEADDYRGNPTISDEALFAQVSEIHNRGYQVAIHTNGDASIEQALDVFEAVQTTNPREDARHTLIHAQMMSTEQLDRAAELGITPSFFVAHTYYWGDRHRDVFLGPERAEKISPLNTAIAKNVPFTIHLDTPVVPMEPMVLVWTAVNRETTSGETLGANERISVMDALRATTIDSAWQQFLEADRGSIEVGKFADLIILSDDPLTNPDTLNAIKVIQTIIGGATVFQRE